MSKNIRRVGDDRLAGNSRLFFIEPRHVLRPIARQGVQITGNVQLLNSRQWNELESTIYSAQLDTAGEQTQHGTIYQHEVAGFFEGDSPAVAEQFAAMAGRRYTILVRDFAGRIRLAGGDQVGLLFSYKFQSGKKPREAKGYSWTLKGKSTQPALFYNGLISVAPDADNTGGEAGNVPSVRVYDRRGRLMATVPIGSNLIITSGFRVSYEIQ